MPHRNLRSALSHAPPPLDALGGATQRVCTQLLQLVERADWLVPPNARLPRALETFLDALDWSQLPSDVQAQAYWTSVLFDGLDTGADGLLDRLLDWPLIDALRPVPPPLRLTALTQQMLQAGRQLPPPDTQPITAGDKAHLLSIFLRGYDLNFDRCVTIPYHLRLRDVRQIPHSDGLGPYAYEARLLINGRAVTLSMNRVHQTVDGYRFLPLRPQS